MSDHLIAEANRHAKALPKMTLPTTKPNDRDLEWYIAECVDLKKQLAMECAAKREHMRIACAEINELKVKVLFFEREIARLRADSIRLNFIDSLSPGDAWCIYRSSAQQNANLHAGDPRTLRKLPGIRAAIDLALKEAQP